MYLLKNFTNTYLLRIMLKILPYYFSSFRLCVRLLKYSRCMAARYPSNSFIHSYFGVDMLRTYLYNGVNLTYLKLLGLLRQVNKKSVLDTVFTSIEHFMGFTFYKSHPTYP